MTDPTMAVVELGDLIARLRKAISMLDLMVETATPSNVERLRGKGEGVKLALSYAEEAWRSSQDC